MRRYLPTLGTIIQNMLIDQYFTEKEKKVTVTHQQASNFAKKVADDFNPLHDIETKKFCVPGDLLFSLILTRYGINSHMTFTFSGMVNDTTTLLLPAPAPELALQGENGKEYLKVNRSGASSNEPQLIDSLINSYVAFSGKTFPHLLVPLLKEKNMMINPARPLVMYQSMVIDLNNLEAQNISLHIDKDKTVMAVNGKRGNACLAFNLMSGDEIVGTGEKHMVLSGLVDFEEHAANSLTEDYLDRKKQFLADT